ncbi:uncharacterized protein LOC110153086 [Boleophthalmus pectinirostris]|uniref:uncharacterized protein LOC110153086 n=1 Tax=Boleophthalmus pectinirostris TaxID=150288 RepID=UPI00242D0E3D|nr:uncharacterized protein LOC110153086 [Boleophthalmus pectinirostris]XP_055017949.1 uncharacterized protein LOC110153086 [Boleophthalmus pectinirostris]
MPSFDILNRVELYLRKRKFHPETTAAQRYVARKASKHFIYKDGCLLRKYRGRLLQAVMSEEQVREIMVQFHDNNNHAGRVRMVREIMSMYYWVGVTDMVKDYIKRCDACKERRAPEASEVVQYCLAYGCDGSSYIYPELTFHKFPKPGEQRQRWLVVAQRDEGSVRKGSRLCSRHFEPDCFFMNEEGHKELRPDAVPTIIGVSKQTSDSEEPLFHPSSLEDLLTCAAATAEVCPVGFSSEQSDPPLQEHQYSLRVPERHPREAPDPVQESRQSASFTTYNHIARYLSHRILPQQSKKRKGSLRRMAKRFTLIDGVLYYNLRSPPVRVPRSREEVNAILQQFHDNGGHYGHGTCFKAIVRHYYWYSMSRDLSCWISRCPTCLSRSKRKWLRCSIMTCTNCCGPVERKLGLTFHNFPMDSPPLLARWLKAAGRPHWYPHLWSSVCSVHFTEDCFDRSGGREVLKPDAVPTIKTHGDEAIQGLNESQNAAEADEDQEDAFFAKYDAVELYISTRTYPPGLTYVEKNTFRRFCKKYFVKDGVLHIRVRDRAVPVLRNRQQVNEALREYHDELNHLEVNKCLRLLNERCNWRTMRSDITQWISKCVVCRLKNKPKIPPVQKQDGDKKLRPQLSKHRAHSDSEEEEEDENISDGSETESDTEIKVQRVQPKPQKQVQVQVKTPVQSQTKVRVPAQNQVPNKVQTPIETPNSKVHIQVQNQVQTQIPTQILSQVQIQSQTQVPTQVLSQVQTQSQTQVPTQVLSQVQTQSQTHVPTQVLSQVQTQSQTQVPTQVLSQVQTQVQTPVQVPILVHLGPPLNLQSGGPILLTPNTLMTQIWGQEQNPTSTSTKAVTQGKQAKQSKKEKSEIQMVNPNTMNYQHEEQVQTSRGRQQVLMQRVEVSHTEVIQASPSEDTHKQSAQSPQRPTHSSRGRPLKRKFFPDEEVPVKKVQRESVEPVVSSSKPECATQSPQRQTAQRDKKRADSEHSLEARVVVQQCSRARVKTRAGVDGTESQYAQIGEGLVVYVCFFEGATDDTTQRIADSIMNTRFFRTSLRRQICSVLDLPGSVLLVPQESLGFEPGPRRSMQSRGVSEAWVGKQLFSSLYLHCTHLLCARATGGGTVEQGLYGQRQEIEITSTEPMSHVLEF